MILLRNAFLSFLIVSVFSIELAFSQAAVQQEPAVKNIERPKDKNVSRANTGSVGIVTGDIGGPYMRMASDMAAVLDQNRTKNLRLIPIPGRGGIKNIEDLLYLRGIDLAIVQADILDYMERERKHRNIRKKIRYIAKLFESEIHIIARGDVKNIKQLHGKKVNFRVRGSSSDLTGRAIFRSENISIIPTYFDQALALEKVKSGELAASVIVTARPSRFYTQIPAKAGLKLLPVKYNARLSNTYLPAKLTHKDYPGLIPKGKSIQTIASSTVLAVYNWPSDSERYRKVSRFISGIFTHMNDLKKPGRHKKWINTSPVTEVDGWTRFKPASKWVANARKRNQNRNISVAIYSLKPVSAGEKKMTPKQKDELYKQFDAYISETEQFKRIKAGDKKEMDKLFEDFKNWKKKVKN